MIAFSLSDDMALLPSVFLCTCNMKKKTILCSKCFKAKIVIRSGRKLLCHFFVALSDQRKKFATAGAWQLLIV